MNVQRFPLSEGRFHAGRWSRRLVRAPRDPLAAPRALAFGLSLAILVWLLIAAFLVVV